MHAAAAARPDIKVICRAQCELRALKLGRELLVNASRFKDLTSVFEAAREVFQAKH